MGAKSPQAYIMRMHMEEKDVIEVEVLAETTSEVEKSDKPKKNVTYLSKSDRASRLLLIAARLSRVASPLTFLFGAGGLAFSILYSQGGATPMLVMMAICWSGALASLVTTIIAFLLGVRARHLLADESEGE